ncbi:MULTISPECIES: monovalent cation/H(+) antiporter subunit G [Roseibium]|jgi:multicomponent Na+:H+ antiporter subunit G|uniref:Na+/H+ antiporter subunit G n=1 Tax=Roseibium aggregatum (strain ATCC 25650 / DSM 13394 / JCM 20685 / NBRC 16684 / NCIMB 2208 / IAM 12614 / B1) TaxID=384765 RepID=A0P302_ROSAI|nr:monovalent cation/H(+) antiporter subunit G [Roseibium aggregatum]EAV40611.1 Na+/H+ antiporter subunit G [Stappia aggregata IAM 12614] [Roseibium aggregatum IAM 12614]MEE4011497.1 monovalent cation/H(+) antiporter subunit G [Roseibium sp. FZY0029]
MNAAVEIITGIMLIIGASFALVASIGIIRLKDVYMRMHAASKAGTLGSGVMLLALAVHASDLAVVTRAIAGVVFFLLTAPISAHLLAKAAYAAGYRPCADTKVDALEKIVRPKS